MHSATAGDFSDLSIVGTLGDAPAAALVARRLGASQSLRSCAVVGDEVVAAAGFGFSIASGVLSLPRAIPPNRSRLSGVVPEARSRIGWAAVSPFSQEKYWGSSMPLIYRAVASHELVADASRPTISHRLGESISSVIGRKMPQHPHLRDGRSLPKPVGPPPLFQQPWTAGAEALRTSLSSKVSTCESR